MLISLNITVLIALASAIWQNIRIERELKKIDALLMAILAQKD